MSFLELAKQTMKDDLPAFCPSCGAYWECEHKASGLWGEHMARDLRDNPRVTFGFRLAR